MKLQFQKNKYELLYKKYNNKNKIKTDPVQFIYKFKSIQDKELAAFISACFAYGRVELIIKNLNEIFSILNNKPYESIISHKNKFEILFKNSKYRYNNSSDFIYFFYILRNVLIKYGSIKKMFSIALSESDNNLKKSLIYFVDVLENILKEQKKILKIKDKKTKYLFPNPKKGSACKRLNLFLKWMIRKDNVDPGIWSKDFGFLKSELIIPLDTHILKNAIDLEILNSKVNSWKSAEKITSYLKQISPDDPLKYDFAICHSGMDFYRK